MVNIPGAFHVVPYDISKSFDMVLNSGQLHMLNPLNTNPQNSQIHSNNMWANCDQKRFNCYRKELLTLIENSYSRVNSYRSCGKFFQSEK